MKNIHGSRLLFIDCTSKSISDMFFPSVFPGGIVDAADEMFENSLSSSVWKSASDAPPTFAELISQPVPTSGKVFWSDSISDRLAAIREVFEECGVLVALPQQQSSSIQSDHSSSSRDLAQVFHGFESSTEAASARSASSADALSFMSMCTRYGILPDLNALHPYTRWVTPPHETRRCTSGPCISVCLLFKALMIHMYFVH